jgi:16S rRNA (guanine1207-N2)-methyltransferase
VTTSLAQRKARLLFCQPDPACAAVTSRYPVSYRLDAADCLIEDHANVFSVGALDLGTRFFLPWIPAHDEPLRIADLGCGNGILGLCAAQRCPGATVDFFDESFMALASAEGNFSRACPGREARFIAADGLAGVPDQSYDLILCNPPFHQQHVVGDFIARQLFMDAHRALKSGGELRVVGNRHLGYAQMLRRLFGSADVLAVNPKFVVIRALRR